MLCELEEFSGVEGLDMQFSGQFAERIFDGGDWRVRERWGS